MRPKTGTIDQTREGRFRVRITLSSGDRRPLGTYDTEASPIYPRLLPARRPPNWSRIGRGRIGLNPRTSHFS
jgi:hypothetical protein